MAQQLAVQTYEPNIKWQMLLTNIWIVLMGAIPGREKKNPSGAYRKFKLTAHPTARLVAE